MKINAKLLLLTFSVITLVSVSTAFIYHTLAQKLLQSQQSKALVNSANDFIFVFQEFVDEIDSSYHDFYKSHNDFEKSNLDFIFGINSDSTINKKSFIVKPGAKVYKNVSTLTEFLKYNTSLVVRNVNNKGSDYFYGKEINSDVVNELSSKIRAEIALVEGNVVSKFTNDIENQYYLPHLSRITRGLKGKNNFEIIHETIDEVDLSATHYSPKTSVTSNEEIDFIIFTVSTEASAFTNTMNLITAVIVVSGIFLTVIFLFLFSTRLRKQLEYITKGVKRIAEGDIESRVKVISKDEIGNLGNAFNNMLDEIEKRDIAEKEYLEFISLINKNPSLEEIGDAALSKIISLTQVDVGAFYLYNDGLLMPFSILGLPLDKNSFIDEAGFYKKAREKKDLIEIKFKENHPIIKTGITELKISYLYVLPIFYNSELISILEIASVNKPEIDVREYLYKIKNQLSIGLANGKSLSELRSLVKELKELNKAYEEQNVQILNKNQELVDLHEKLKKGSEELEVQTTKAIQSEQLKSQFLANMSHELRTPQNAILGLTELILKDNSTSDETKERLNVVLRNGKKLLTLIENILEYSKLESGNTEVKFSKILLSELLHEVESFVKPFFINGNLHFNIIAPTDYDYELFTDTKKLEQILYNLIGNAVKFTKNGFVKLEFRVSENDLSFTVEDSGPGILELDQKRIFNEFTQIDADLNRKFSGTGLGLAVCKRYVELLKGSITVESILKQGSIFSVRLPNQVKSRIQLSHSLNQIDEEKPNLKGCMISDGIDSPKLMTDYLKAYQIDLRLLKYSELLFDNLVKSPPNFIILDLLSIPTNGWNLLWKLKSNAELKNIPVIVVNMDEEANCGLGLNIYQYNSLEMNRINIYESIEKIEQHQGIKFRKLLFVGNQQKYEALEYETLFDNIKSFHSDGKSSIAEFVKQKEPDLIFIDLFDASIDSFNILVELNSVAYTKDIPIIAFVGFLEHDNIVTQLNNKLLETTLVNQFNPLDVLKVIKDRIELIDSSAFYEDRLKLETTENALELQPENVARLTEEIKILIVDDNSDARFTIGEIVKSLGYNPDFATDGFECLDKLKSDVPDLVLLDIMMPKMDGFKTIAEIRKNSKHKSLKVYALTAYAMLSDKEIIEKNGFDGLLTKPINSLQLERKLNNLFKTIS